MQKTKETKEFFQLNPILIFWFKYFTKGTSLLLIALGCSVLIGWFLGNLILESVVPGLMTMPANTALCFILLGFSLWIKNSKSTNFLIRFLGTGSAFLVFLIGLLTILEYSFGWDLKIDRLLFLQPDSSLYPGRMAPVTATNFVLFGISLFFLDSRFSDKWIQILTFIGILVSFLGVIGYSYQVKILFNLVAFHASMVLHTSVAFILAGLAILHSRPEKGFMKVITSNSAGGLLARQLFPAAIFIPPIAGYFWLLGERKGIYESPFGIALFALSNMIIFTILIWRNAVRTYEIDQERQEAKEKLLRAYDELELKVQERTEKLQASEEQTRLIIETAYDAFVGMDSHGMITGWNTQAEKTFGWSKQEAIGRSLAETIVPPSLREAHNRGLKRFLATGEGPVLSKRIEMNAWHREGREFPVELTISPLKMGGTYVFNAFVHDITERKKIDRMKNEFVSTVSHELRTPLTSVRGSLGLIAEGLAGKVPPEMEPLLKIGINNCERLIRLINDVLDIERMEAGKMAFQMKPLELTPLIQQSIEMNQNYADQYKVQFILENQLSGVKINVDEGRFIQIMTNLLSNAAKFSPPGETVIIKITRHPPWVRVSVIDHGPGMPKEFQNRVFEKFSQADSSDSRRKEGTGLGLSICKAFIEKMGGKINFETSDKGSTFYFDLKEV